jgi:hypothetical protein
VSAPLDYSQVRLFVEHLGAARCICSIYLVDSACAREKYKERALPEWYMDGESIDSLPFVATFQITEDDPEFSLEKTAFLYKHNFQVIKCVIVCRFIQ